MVSKITVATFFFITLLYLWTASIIQLDPWSEQDLFNSRTLPYVYGSCLLISVFFIAMNATDVKLNFNANAKKLTFIILSLLAFLSILQFLGLWFSLGFLILSNMLILGQRKPFSLISLSFAFPLICWLVVEKGLGISIPI